MCVLNGSCLISGVKIGIESLPRSETSLLSLKLGGLFLRDLTTQGSIFPFLVSPKLVNLTAQKCDLFKVYKIKQILSKLSNSFVIICNKTINFRIRLSHLDKAVAQKAALVSTFVKHLYFTLLTSICTSIIQASSFFYSLCSAYDVESSASPVFQMIYERNPIRCKFERRLEVNTSPLNIIYNPQAIKKVADFFYKGRVHTSGISLFQNKNLH